MARGCHSLGPAPEQQEITVKALRYSKPRDRYDPKDEAEFRRAAAESVADNEFLEIRIAGGVLYGDAGALKFRSQDSTVTTVALL